MRQPIQLFKMTGCEIDDSKNVTPTRYYALKTMKQKRINCNISDKTEMLEATEIKQANSDNTIAIVWKHVNSPEKWAKLLTRVEIQSSAANELHGLAKIIGKIGAKSSSLRNKYLNMAKQWTTILPPQIDEFPPLAAYDEIQLLIVSPIWKSWWVRSDGYKVEIEYSIRGE